MSKDAKIDEAIARFEAQRGIRQGSKWKYALLHGVLLFGLPMWIILSGLHYLRHDRHLLVYAIIGLPVWFIFGFLFGLWRWRFGFWYFHIAASILKRFIRRRNDAGV